LFVLTVASVFGLLHIDESRARSATDGPSGVGRATHHHQAQQRELYQASREGLQYGVPQQAIARALSKMHAMETQMARPAGIAAAGNVGLPAVTQAWSYLGPQPMSAKANFTGSAIGSNVAMTGRMTSVAADSRGLIVAGAASGGLWVSTNNGSSFVSVFDSQPTEAIGAVALDTTTNPSTIYVAAGEGSSSIDSLYGSGLYKSANLGQTWTALAAGTFDRASFTSIAIDTQTTPGSPRIFVGATSGFSGNRADAGIFETDSTKAGLWFSSNGGSSFTHYPETTFDGCDLIGDGSAPCAADDVVIDPSNPGNVYVAIDTDAVYSSNDGGRTFHKALFPGVNFIEGRQTLAVGPSVPPPNGPPAPAPGGVVYAMIGAGDGNEYANMFDSFDAGASWLPGTVLEPTVPSFTANGVAIDGTNSEDFSQSFYDPALLVSPTDPSTLFFGGVGLYKSAGTYGHSWTFLAPNGGIHPDQHDLTWDPANNKVLVANDGGLFMFDPTQATPTFTSLNQMIDASQIQGIGPHPTDQTKLVAGFQSNGTQLYSGSVSGWVAPDTETGDGGFAFYDPSDANFLYHDFSLDQITGALISTSSDGGVTWCTAPDANIPACNVLDDEWTLALEDQLILADDPGPVYYPALAVDPSVKHRVWFGAHSIYVSTDGMAHWAQQTDDDLTSDGTAEGGGICEDSSCAIEDVEFGPPNAQSKIFPAWALAMSDLEGTVAFAVSNTTQANVQLDSTHSDGATWADVTDGVDAVLLKTSPALGVLSTQATSIAPDPHNLNVAYLGLSGFTSDTQVGHIYKTVDFGVTWTEADGNSVVNKKIVQSTNGLPDVPVLKILVDATDNSGTCGKASCSNSVYAGTDIGVFHSSDGGATWQPFNLGSIPSVPVYDIAQNSSGVVFIGTHGRGAFRLGAASATATPSRTATPTPTATSTSKATATATTKNTPTATPTSNGTATATAMGTTTPTATPTPNGAKISAPTSVKVVSTGIGLSSAKTSFTIKNAGKKGSGTLSGNVSMSDTSIFSIAPSSFSLAPGKSQKELVTFSPTMTTNTAMATLSSNDSFNNNQLTVTLSGAGLPGKVSAPKTVSLSAKAGATASKNLTIKNSGKGELAGSWPAITSSLASPFTVAAGSFDLQPGQSARPIAISYSPSAKGASTPVNLVVSVTSPGAVGATVVLKGKGK
jgi:hypothetical protein